MPALQSCAGRFADKHPEDAARVLEQSQAADAAPFLGDLTPEVAAKVMAQMSLAAAAENLSLLSLDRAVAVSAELPAGSAAALLRRLDPALRADVLAQLPEDRADRLVRLLEYPSGTVGAAVDPEVLAIPSDVTSEAARRLLRRRGGLFHHQLYIVDRSRRLLGFVHVRDLVRGAPNAPVSNMMRSATVQLQASARIASAISNPAWHDMDAIPVVDKSGVLLGILRHRQLRGLAVQPTTSALSGTLLGLSELYWIGLSSLLPPVRAANSIARSDARAGGDRAK